MIHLRRIPGIRPAAPICGKSTLAHLEVFDSDLDEAVTGFRVDAWIVVEDNWTRTDYSVFDNKIQVTIDLKQYSGDHDFAFDVVVLVRVNGQAIGWSESLVAHRNLQSDWKLSAVVSTPALLNRGGYFDVVVTLRNPLEEGWSVWFNSTSHAKPFRIYPNELGLLGINVQLPEDYSRFDWCVWIQMCVGEDPQELVVVETVYRHSVVL